MKKILLFTSILALHTVTHSTFTPLKDMNKKMQAYLATHYPNQKLFDKHAHFPAQEHQAYGIQKPHFWSEQEVDFIHKKQIEEANRKKAEAELKNLQNEIIDIAQKTKSILNVPLSQEFVEGIRKEKDLQSLNNVLKFVNEHYTEAKSLKEQGLLEKS